MNAIVICHQCGYEQEMERKIFRQETCPKCSAWLHCCLQCRHYDVRAYHECKESEATWVHDKELANFCDYFELKDPAHTAVQNKAKAAQKKLDDLFKK